MRSRYSIGRHALTAIPGRLGLVKRFVFIGLVACGLLLVVGQASAKKPPLSPQPGCGDTLYANTTLSADVDCSGYNGTALYMGKNGITLDLNKHTIWGFTGNDSRDGVDTNGYNMDTITNGTIANFGDDVYLYYSSNTKVTKLKL